jgi:hypothetical protein
MFPSSLTFGMQSSNHSSRHNKGRRSLRAEASRLEEKAEQKFRDADVKRQIVAPELFAQSDVFQNASNTEAIEASFSEELADEAFRNSTNPFLPLITRQMEYDYALRRKSSSINHLNRQDSHAHQAFLKKEAALEVLEEASEDDSEGEHLASKADSLTAKAALEAEKKKKQKYPPPARQAFRQKEPLLGVLEEVSEEGSEGNYPASRPTFLTARAPLETTKKKQKYPSAPSPYIKDPVRQPTSHKKYEPGVFSMRPSAPQAHVKDPVNHLGQKKFSEGVFSTWAPAPPPDIPNSAKAGIANGETGMNRVYSWRQFVEEGLPPE